MIDTHLELWAFDKAPQTLRDCVPMPSDTGMVVLVLPGGAGEIVDYLVARWTLLGFSVVRKEREDGSVVLAGPELPVPPRHPLEAE